MKNLITLLFLFLGLGIATAQTEAETLEWLNTKKTEIRNPFSLTVRSSGKIIFSLETIKVYDDEGASTEFNWNEVKDIKFDKYNSITLVRDKMFNGETSFIKFSINNKELLDKYVKAIKHMATLKGAKLVNDDLF